MQNKTTVTITREDRTELFHMIKSRGNSALKTKLVRALSKVSPYLHAALPVYEKEERNAPPGS